MLPPGLFISCMLMAAVPKPCNRSGTVRGCQCWASGTVWLQVAILSEGRCVYFGEPGDVVPWFSGQLGHPYNPTAGSISDWVVDLVSLLSSAVPHLYSISSAGQLM